ncbi:fatty acid desaturase family protein [Legionella sp. WA2024007413]
MLSNEEYTEVRKSLNFKRQLTKSLGFLIADIALLYAAVILLGKNNLLFYCLGELFLAILFLHNFILLHECGHNTLSNKSWLNVVLGHYMSIFCCMPFYPWKIIHEEHHKWTGHIDKDPVFELLKQAKISKKLPWIFHVGWRTFIPLNVLFLHLVYWTYPLKLLKQKKLSRIRFRQCLFSVLFLFFAYVFLKWCFPSFVTFKNLVPAILIYGVLWETLSTPQHLGLEPTQHRPTLKEHTLTTRSTWFPRWLQHYLFLNFGYHVEHHFFPALPWHELEKAHYKIKPLLSNEYQMVTGGIWNIQMRSQNMEKAIGVRDD